MASPGSSTGSMPKNQEKSKRKISLPWFRQGSVAKNHHALTRQHTIDTPSSFQARLKRQPSQPALAGVLEMTWVMSDFVATAASELSVSKGQQVEVIEMCSSRPDYCLVRMPTRGADHDAAAAASSVPEGLVPLAVLKQPPTSTTTTSAASRGSPSRKQQNATAVVEFDVDTSISNDTALNTSSPVNKRRGFSGRKWLPPPLRKLSQGKVDKSQTSVSTPPPLKKTGSDKRIRVPSSDMGNKPSVSEGEEEDDRPVGASSKPAKSSSADMSNGGGAGEEVDEELELPPPMKPIQEPILTAAPPQPSSMQSARDLEDNPCKREQHSEIQERHIMMRDAKSENALVDYGEISSRPVSNETNLSTLSGDESDNKPAEEVEDGAKKREMLIKKREYVLRELIDTEEAYVRDLSLIVEGYIAAIRDPQCEIPMPDDLRDGKDKLVFGNIEVIYEWHKDIFIKYLKQAVENPIELASLFRRYERKLQMYVIYCKNKHVSEYIVSEYLETYFEELRVKLGHKLQLCDLLIKPVQRIMKYQLMLKDILKYTERAGIEEEIEPMRAAYNIMVVVPKAANDMMDVGRLQGFEGKITSQGKLLIHGILTVSDVPGSNTMIGKNKELQVFFFEQSIIFSEIVGKKTQFTNPQYTYKAHIQVNKMCLADEGDDFFVLVSTDPSRSQMEFMCQTATRELCRQWLTTIKETLQKQTDFMKAIQSPIAYQKELTKEASLSDLSTWGGTKTPTSDASKQEIRKNHYIHKANTIGIPSEKELDDYKNNNPKLRLNFFEGFRNTLKSKHKSDTAVLEAAKENNQVDSPRRWSEANQPIAEQIIMPPGTQARLICEWPDLTLGELVTILRHDPVQGYYVKASSNLQESWVPIHALTIYSRKPWSFRFRKPRKSIDDNANQEQLAHMVPHFKEKLKDVMVQSGTKVLLECKVKISGKVTKHVWKKIEPNHCVLHHGKFTQEEPEEGSASLTIDNAKVTDSGTYSFTISNDFGTATCKATLTVTNNFAPVPEPAVQVLSSSSVLLEWEGVDCSQFVVEYCKLGSGEWVMVNDGKPVVSQPFTVDNLSPGETYSFRSVSLQNNFISLPSITVSLPVAENLRWQQEQFERRYMELNEIGRGKFSIVRLARDRGTGVEVALKQISRRKQSFSITRAEYSLLGGMQHKNVIRSLALFENAPSPGIDTIVLELVKGPLLFDHICDKESYSEAEVREYVCQIMSALEWLHQNDISHLDIKPENVLVDLSSAPPHPKIVDFGESVSTTSKSVILPPSCLEFASPELVLGQPVGKRTDCWAAGVFVYVLLSGVSPFLDDSMEETTANILKGDYSFPADYFGEVSEEAKVLIKSLLVLAPSSRSGMKECLASAWMKKDTLIAVISSSRLKSYMQRRHPINVSMANEQRKN